MSFLKYRNRFTRDRYSRLKILESIENKNFEKEIRDFLEIPSIYYFFDCKIPLK